MKYTKSDFADTCTCPQIILKFINSGFSGIQTHDLFFSHCMVLLVYQRAQFSRRLISNDPLNLFYDSYWMEIDWVLPADNFKGL